MARRRRRIVLYHEHELLLIETRRLVGRSAELIAATDSATIEAALRLYQDIDVVLAEKSSARLTPITLLRLAQRHHPDARRVLLVEHEALNSVYDAVHDRTINDLMFLPVRTEQLLWTLGLDEPEQRAVAAPAGRLAAGNLEPMT